MVADLPIRWPLRGSCEPHGDATLVLFSRDQGTQDGLQLLSKLQDVYLIGNQRIWPLLVAVEKDLLDQFFTKQGFHLLPSIIPN